MSTNRSDWLTVAEAAEVLHLSGQTIRKLCRNGELPAWKVGGQWLIHRKKMARMRLSA